MRKHKQLTLLGLVVVMLILFFSTLSIDQFLVSAENIFIKMQIFNLILNEIQKSYIEEVDPIELMEDAIKGMLANLDPHTTYLPREQFESWFKKFDGFGGIGVYYDVIRGYVTVTSVIDNSPAEEAGILANDKIVAINGEDITGAKHDRVSEKLKGQEGSQVTLTIERDSWATPRDIKLRLRRILISSVPDAYMLNHEIGYIFLAKFTATSQNELRKAILLLQEQGMRKLILDLRNNGGGLMHAAVDISDLFLPGKRKIVFKKGRSQNSYEAYFTTGKAPFASLPLLILVNHATASSSEIVAGAIQDWDRGLIIGEPSFGKGLVQSQIRFADNSALLITTARYYTPSGRLIQRDYHQKSKVQYYYEAYDDTLRDKMQKISKQDLVFKSMQGRQLLAGGGISPDIVVKADSENVSVEIQNLYYVSKIKTPVLARFAEDYIKHSQSLNSVSKKNNRNQLAKFLKTFKLTETDWAAFRKILEEANISLTAEQINANKTDLEFLISREICFRIWGEYGRFMVKLTRDNQLNQAIKCFPKTEQLLDRSLELYQSHMDVFQP